MTQFIVRMLLISIPTMIGITMVLFAVISAAPGDPFGEIALNPNVPPETRAQPSGIFTEYPPAGGLNGTKAWLSGMSPGGADSVAFGFGPMLLPGDRPPVDFFVPLLLHALVRSRTGMNAAAIQALRCRWVMGGSLRRAAPHRRSDYFDTRRGRDSRRFGEG